jgi:uncharacterized protein (DUF2141 family)
MSTKKSVALLATLVMLAAMLCAASAIAKSPARNPGSAAAPIIMVIWGFPDSVGRASCALYNQPDGFATYKHVYRHTTAPISGSTATCRFNNVPSGSYAVAFFHDRKMNNRMQKDALGIPREGFGFSNNATPHGLGAPSFQEASFSHDALHPTTIDAKLQQWRSAL